MRRLLAALAAAAALTAAAAPAHAAPVPWGDPADIAVSPDGRNVYAAGSKLLSLARDQQDGALAQIGETPLAGTAVALAPDGRFVYVGGPGVVHVVARDPDGGKLVHVQTITGGSAYGIALGDVRDLDVAPDGTALYVTQTRENAFVVLQRDPLTGALRRGQAFFDSQPGEFYAAPIVTSPDGSDVYLAGERLAHFRRGASGAQLTRVADPDIWADDAAVSRDGRFLYSRHGNDVIASTRDAATGELTPGQRATPDGDHGCSGCSRSAPIVEAGDGRFVTAVPAAGEIHLWRRGEVPVLEQKLSGIADLPQVAEIAASPDGRFLYASGGTWDPDPLHGNVADRGAITTLRADGDRLEVAGTLLPEVAGWVRPGTPGVSIENGAIYVNSVDVTIRVRTPGWNPASFEVSNDGGFAGATRMAVDPSGEYRWRLPAGATPERMVKRIYLRFTPNGQPQVEFPAASVVTDDVILDTRAPQLVSARVRGKQLLLRARDDRSGVKTLQVTTNRKRPGTARRYKTRVAAPRGARSVYVRVLDAAGNRSGWKRAVR